MPLPRIVEAGMPLPQNRGRDASPTESGQGSPSHRVEAGMPLPQNRGKDAPPTESGQGCPSYRIHIFLFPFGLGGGAGMLVVLVDIVFPWRGEDIKDACGSLRDNA